MLSHLSCFVSPPRFQVKNMNLTLRLIQRPGQGREIQLKEGTFAIGRSGECYLRVRSDLVSRRHCEIRVTDTSVVVQDLGSKNGTFVNQQRIDGVRELNKGDVLEVGPLKMEIHYVPVAAPPVDAPQTAGPPPTPPSSEEDDISTWLDDVSVVNVASRDTDAVTDDETRQVKFHRPADDDTATGDSTLASAGGQPADQRRETERKQQPGKLPPIPKEISKDSSEAAQDILRQMQQRR